MSLITPGTLMSRGLNYPRQVFPRPQPAGAADSSRAQAHPAGGGQPRRHPSPHKALPRNELSHRAVTGGVGELRVLSGHGSYGVLGGSRSHTPHSLTGTRTPPPRINKLKSARRSWGIKTAL